MKQLIQMFIIDVQMNFKSFMGVYMIIVPIVILLILRSFLPNVANSTATIAVIDQGPHAVAEEIINDLKEYATVERYDNIEDMKKKLRGTGSAEGLYFDPEKDQYVSLLERNIEDNTIFSVGSRAVRQHIFREKNPDAPRVVHFTHEIPPELSDRSKTSPVATIGGAVFMIFLIMINSFLIGLGIVNDKENGTDKAIWVSPVNRFDYFVGKSIYPLLIMAFYTIVALFVLNLIHVNIAFVYITMLVSYSCSMLFGLVIGAIGNNENEAVGIGKMLNMFLMLSILGATLLPSEWQWVVWWAPFYWIYNTLEKTFTESATVQTLLINSAVMLILTGFYFLILKKRILKGLS